jgi:uncharacterized protein involved in exopolysaccharide biosynthesis
MDAETHINRPASSQGGGGRPGVRRIELEDEATLLDVVIILLRHRRLLVIVPFVLFVVVVLSTLAAPRTYTAVTTFAPYSPDPPQVSGAMGLAAQFGINLSGGGGQLSPDFYAELITTRPILMSVVETQYEVVRPRGFPLFRDSVRVEGNLVEVMEMSGRPYPEMREIARGTLADMISVSTNRGSGTIRVSVTSDSPELSGRIAERIVGLVHDFNLERRQSQAAAERRFTEERVEAARRELMDAENELERFLQQNRIIQSPELQFRHDRLQREVTMRQQLYSSLAQSYEQARIEEVRNTPVITVVQPPEPPVLPDRRRLLFKGFAAILLGGVVACGAALALEFASPAGKIRAGDGVQEFERLKQEIAAEIRRPWRLLQRDERKAS